ncbi:MAG TPA: amino acid adenylation domain-containing protein [Longimicrobium sp.]|nr:amino acid adenylation domain-containing protein [Longimicrobium sp.]
MPPQTAAPLSREEKQALLRRMLVQKISRTRTEPASFAQERLWFLERMNGASPLYNLPEAQRLSGALDVPALERAIGEVVRRHEALRTTFREVDGAPVQVIVPFAGFSLPVDDLSALAADAREAEVSRRATEDAALCFDLEQGPLFRARLLRLADDEHVLLLCMHHIVTDGWSMGVFFREVSAAYEAYLSGGEPALPALPQQYAHYAAEQRGRLQGEALDRELAWWKERMAGAPALLELPTDHPRPAVQSYRGAQERVEIPRDVTERLQALGRAEGASLYMVLLGAFQVLLGRYAGADDVVVGSPIAGRTRPEVEGLIGFFVNTLVLRTDLSGDPGFRELLRRVRTGALGAYAHQEVPFERVVAELQPERSMGHSPLFQAMFTLNEVGAGKEGFAGLRVSRVAPETGTAKFDLLLGMSQNEDGLAGEMVYATDLFHAGTIRRMLVHLGRVLEQVSADPDVRLSALQLTDTTEREQVLYGWNRTVTGYPDQASIHGLFAEQAARTPEALAAAFDGATLSYAELDARANRLANHLASLGVGRESRVGLCLERSAEMVIATLAILKAGGAYVPLDPAYPRERLAFMLADSGVRVLVTEDSLRAALPAEEAGVAVVSVDGDRAAIAAASADAPRTACGPRDLAYVIYTSGSTGTPKGVGVEHRSVVRLVRDTDYVDLGPADRIGQASNVSFDAATFEIWGALLNGGAVVGLDKDVALSPAGLADAIRDHGITTLFLTTALFNGIARDRPDAFTPLTTLMFGGEAVDPASVRRVLAAGGPRRLLHVYGPTENTTFSSWHRVDAVAENALTVPIGRTLAHSSLRVLDQALQPVPVGVPGELYVGGDGLARGYLGRAALTAERFVPDPFAERAGERMYRTGDRVRWTAEGSIEYLARLDGQVKVRGFRIEIGEIEAALRRHPAVSDCTVMARADGAAGRQVVAYVVGGADAEELRAHLRASLPDYMVPAAFVAMDAIPLNPNGKVDRRALPAPDWAAGADAYVAPRTPAEEVLAGIWAGVLNLERVGVHDDFFQLGGHSLLATRVVSRVRAVFGVELPLRMLFEAPTVAGVAERVEGLRRAGLPQLPPVVPVERTDALPLSFAQERLWFLDRMEPDSPFYNVPMAVRLEGALDAGALERALGGIVSRHEALRTVFTECAGKPVQVVTPFAGFALAVEDLSALASAEREAAVKRLCAEDAARPFDLAAGPLLRASLLRLGVEEHVLLLCIHHIASDGWSMGVLFRELSALYEAHRDGRESPLAPLPVQYADFAVWQREQLRGEALERQLGYWKARLGGAPALLELPTDHPRPAVQTYRGAQEELDLSPGLLERLRELGRREGATLYMVLLGAFQSLLSKYAGTDDVLVGTPVAGRTRREVEELIGFFVNTLVLRTDLSGDPAFREVLRRVRDVTLGAYEHQDLPFEKLVAELQPERSLAHAPLFQVMLSLIEETRGVDEGLPGVRASAVEGDAATTKFDLTLGFDLADGGFRALLSYNTDLFERGTARRMLRHLAYVLEQVAGDADARLSQLELLDGAERRTVLEEWNRTEAEYRSAATVHGLIAEQAARTPDAEAVVFRGTTLTYAELEARANRLAHHLRALGAGPEARVGICLERSAETLVAMLAVLKAGAAYLPLDPSYPADRLAYMLEDSGAPLLVTQAALRTLLPTDGVKVVSVDEDASAIALKPADAPRAAVHPANAAYVIYTSGSTGKPKGVQVTHGNAVSFFAGMDGRVGGPVPGTWLAVTRTSFDIHVLELLWTLARGFRVVVQPEPAGAEVSTRRVRRSTRPMEFSLFYFSSGEDEGQGNKYRLLLEGAKFADRNGFSAVWTPERHFHSFGAVFPNPAVTGAAVAAVTERVGIRAGSVVLPLHDPVRVAEEWSVVDNLSGGRVGFSIASGWQPNDFVLAPEKYADRRDGMFRDLETVRALWRGEAITRANGVGKEISFRVLPRPVQPELPVWVTAGGSPDTFRRAGQVGANLLTHLLGQTVEELAEKVALYRQAYRESGAPGEGHVTLMLHTFVGTEMDTVRETVRAPFKQYLASSADLLKPVAQAAGMDVAGASPEDMDAILDHAFARYWQSAALMGTPDSCGDMVERLKEAGVDEIGCLIDFITDTDVVLDGLRHLDGVRREANRPAVDAADADESIAAQIRRHGVTHLQCTPSLAAMTIAESGIEAIAPLRRLLLGGEALPQDLAAQITSVIPGGLINMYGPTETTVWSATHDVDGPVLIGRPIANARVCVLDAALRPRPAGVPGELFIGGPGVTRGYLNRPGLTADRFVPDAFSAEPGARLYRTGDRARWKEVRECESAKVRKSRGEDASHAEAPALAPSHARTFALEYLGRLDAQVKVRGHRIEPGEIESVLRAHPGVAECAVVARPSASGDMRLVAYVVGTAKAEALRAHVGQSLPDYMVPGAFVALDALPLTPNGKLDRRALPAPDFAAAADAYVAPRTPAEEVLAGIWAGVLGVERVGATENFFALGGHSLLVTRVVARIREVFGVPLPLRVLFETPTVAALAERVETMRRADAGVLPPVVPVERGGALPLSYGQERLWFLNRLEPENTAYNHPLALRLEGALDAAALERALGEVVRRHESLRTVFPERNGAPVQQVLPFTGLALPAEDLSWMADAAREAALRQAMDDEAGRHFDLAAGPVFIPRLLRLGAEEHVLLLSLHHISIDGGSLPALFRELWTLYDAFCEGRESPLAELAVQYPDFAVWQREQLRGEVVDRQLAYWKERMAGAAPLLELPTDRPRPVMQSYRGASEPVHVPGALTERLEALARAEGTTLYMVMLGAWQVLLGRYASTDDVVVGSPIAGRTRHEVEELIGFFVNTLVLRTDLSGDPAFREVLRRVRDVTLGAYEHQDVPFERLVEELQPQRTLSHSPLFQVMFNLHLDRPAETEQGVRWRLMDTNRGTTKFDITLALAHAADGLHGEMEYASDLFDRATIQRMMGHLLRVLEQVADDADARISDLALLAEAERARVVDEWNRTEAGYPSRASIHQLIAEQAARTPDAAAVVFGGASLTYRELDARANRLANHLVHLGVTPEARVGICLERSAEMVIAMLAVLKAGAAYLPLDPSYPADRLAYMLEDSGAPLLVTQAALRTLLPTDGVKVVSVDEDASAIALEPAGAPRAAVDAANAAYVIYTSGSTGRPKGVQVTHGNAVSFFAGMDERVGGPVPGTWLAVTRISFDIHVLELLWTLARGFKVVVQPEADRARDGESIAEQIRRHAVTHLQCTPSLAGMLIAESGIESVSGLERLLLGGEALPADLAAQVTAVLPQGLINMYGPTETTVWSATHAVDAGGPVLIGRPIANTRVYVLDGAMRPQPAGVPGELFIGGAGVTRGYHDRPGLTADRFVPDPFSAEPGARLYRTGDRARWTERTDALTHSRTPALEYLGRLDSQVKIRGFRIEPGEIESVLRRHAGVEECAVVVRDGRLVAYVVGTAQGDALRAHVGAGLPDYMVPNAFVALDALPLTPNGKLDRRALPAPEYASAASSLPPRNELERRVAEVWQAVLGVEAVGVSDNFFDLGGTSMLLTRVFAGLREMRSGLRMVDLFRYTTVESLAGHLGADEADAASALSESRSRADERRAARRRVRGG